MYSTGGSTLLIVFRIIVGMGEGIIFPACNTLIAAWTPLKERSITATIVYSGGMLGSIFGSSISGLLISNYGWSSVFYWFGGASIIWCVIFVSMNKLSIILEFHFNISLLLILCLIFLVFHLLQ